MRYLYFLGAVAIMTASAASAQENNYSNNPAQPMAQPAPTGQLPPNVPPEAYRAWTGNAAAPAAQPAMAAPAPGDNREWPAASRDATRPENTIDSEGGGAIPALPSVVQQSGDITYINGGIGDEDIAELKAHANDYNLHLLISADSGAFISDVKLQVLDARKNPVLSLDDAGPYVYAHLKPGAYTLEATSQGVTKTLKVKLTAKGSVKTHIGFKE